MATANATTQTQRSALYDLYRRLQGESDTFLTPTTTAQSVQLDVALYARFRQAIMDDPGLQSEIVHRVVVADQGAHLGCVWDDLSQAHEDRSVSNGG